MKTVAMTALQTSLAEDAVSGDLIGGGVSGVSCIAWLRRKPDGSDTASVVIGCVDGRIALFTVSGDPLGIVTTGEVIR